MKKKKSTVSSLDVRLFVNTLLLILIFFLLLNTYLTVELKKKLAEPQPIIVAGKSVDLIYLIDGSCTDCYDAKAHRSILGQLGIIFGEEKSIDVSSKEGKKLIDQYDISLVPTVILSEEAGGYELFNTVWGEVGTEEKDGKYVFRLVDALGNVTYRDLKQDTIITSP